jgi:hypothetical protein
MVDEICDCGRHRLTRQRDLISVCLTCRRALGETGRWLPARRYLARHPGLAVSVGDDLCPECRSRRSRARRELPPPADALRAMTGIAPQ